MNKNMDDRELLAKKLENILSLVNDWLKYADQKLAGIIVLNGGIMWGYTRFISGSKTTSGFSETFNVLGYSSVIFSLFFCIIGMLPVLSKLWLLNKKKSDFDNVLYFADIQKYNFHDYLKLLSLKLEIKNNTFTPFDNDFAYQITTNSEIATVKFQRIKISSWLTLAGSLAFIVAILSTFYSRMI